MDSTIKPKSVKRCDREKATYRIKIARPKISKSLWDWNLSQLRISASPFSASVLCDLPIRKDDAACHKIGERRFLTYSDGPLKANVS